MSTAADREEVRKALAAIAERNGGLLTPDAVVAEAATESSVLHELFEWDATKAAHSYRLTQARGLIRSVRIDVRTETTVVSTVGYVRDPDLPADAQGYRSTLKIADDKEAARSVLLAEFSRAAAAMRRAEELAAAFGMTGEISAVTQTIEVMRTKVEARIEQKAALQ